MSRCSFARFIFCSVTVGLSALTIGCSASRQVSPRALSYRYDVYKVKSTDSLNDISLSFGVPEGVLRSINKIDGELTEGQEIRVPFLSEIYPYRAYRSSQGAPQLPIINGCSFCLDVIGNIMWPILGGPLTSKFGERWSKFHEGLDIAAPEGTLVFAAHEGVVEYSGDSLNGYGRAIILKGTNITTLYGHNSRLLVTEGRRVAKGDLIALTGATGHVTGPHLHFETRVKLPRGYVAIDPLFFFQPPANPVTL
jgi:murein DD-endopeptidase MepM/ murein hydrolase activator NlpD